MGNQGSLLWEEIPGGDNLVKGRRVMIVSNAFIGEPLMDSTALDNAEHRILWAL